MAYNPQKQFMRARELARHENPLLFRQAAEQLMKKAAAGEPWAIRELADRYDGKPTQQINVDKEERIKLIAVVPQKAASTEEWLKLVEGKVIEHERSEEDQDD